MDQAGFFDLSDHLEYLSVAGDPLEILCCDVEGGHPQESKIDETLNGKFFFCVRLSLELFPGGMPRYCRQGLPARCVFLPAPVLTKRFIGPLRWANG